MRKLGRFKEAEKIQMEVIIAREESLGLNNEDTLRAKQNYETILMALGLKLEEAVNLKKTEQEEKAK